MVDLLINNTANDFSSVLITSGNNVTVNDKNALTVGAVNAQGNVLFQTAVGAGNDITLAGNILSTTGGITLASGEDINYGANTLTSALRWLTYSVNPVNDTGTIPSTGNAKPNIYDSTFTALGTGVVLPGTGNHHVYSTQPTLTYTANAASRTYGVANPAFSGSVTGLVNGDVAADAFSGTSTFSSTATLTANVGSYDITGAGLSSDIGYKFVQAPANATAFTLNPATLTYTANAANRLYGAADPAFSGSITGFVLGENQGTATIGTLTFSTPAIANSNVGSYALNGSGLAANNGNYTFVQAPANATAFTINPATLTYTANAANRLYGAADPAFSGSITGFVVGDNQGTATTGTLTFSTPAAANANVGSYALNGSGLAANNGNYTFVQAPANATAFTINPAIINLMGDRVYDATAAFGSLAFGTAGTINTGIGGQTLIIAGGPGSVASANVVAGVQILTLGGLALSDGTGLASNYTLVSGTHTGTVTGKTVNVAASRVYEATNSFTAGGFTPTITGTVGGETLSIASGSGTVASANVVAGTQTLILGTLALGDGSGLAGNYILAGGTHTGTVTAKSLTASIIGTPTKIYDGSTSANLTPGNFSVSGFVGVEGATVTQTVGTYNSKDVLTANNVGAALAGADFAAVGGTLFSNYNLPLNSNGVGVITPATLTGNVTAANRIYDATTLATLTGRTLTGVVGADTVIYSGGTATFADKSAGVGKVVTAIGLSLTGADAGNYVVNTSAVTTANITQAAIANVTGITADNKVYDATTTSTLNTLTAGFNGLFAGDVLTVAGVTVNFVDKNVANGKTVNIGGITLGGADGGNYTLTTNTATATANITPAAIASVTGISANNKVYDATTVATLNTVTASFNGMFAGDALTVAAASGAFANKNSAIGKTVNVSGIALGGADAGNYTLTTNTATATANVTPAAIGSVTGITANNKIYDATTTATLNTVTTGFNGLLGGDVLTVAGVTGSFADKNVANGKTVNISGITLGGADAGNYTLTTNTATATANITSAVIASVTGISANNKVYDATTAATLNAAGAVFVGSMGGDMLTVASATGAFVDKNAANGKTVNISSITLAGADAGNYTLTSNTAAAAANITPATLNVSYVGVNKVYDGTTTATVSASDNRLGADVLTINRTASFNDANAASGKIINVTGVGLTGADAGNYAVVTTGIATADITARGITVAANNATKVYGDTDPTLMFNVGGAGLAAGDTITGVITGALARAPGENVSGNPYAISQGSLTSNSNYSITAFTPGQFLITPRALTIGADNKSSVVGNPLPQFTATYNGLAFADSPASLTGTLAFATAAAQASPPGLYAVAPSGQSSSNYATTFVNGLLTVQSGASLIPNDIFAAINSGVAQLPPPFLSGPFIGRPQALSTNLFAAMQLSNVTGGVPDVVVRADDILVAPGAGESQSNGDKPGTSGENRPLLSGAVKHLVNIINGGVKLPNASDIITQGSGVR